MESLLEITLEEKRGLIGAIDVDKTAVDAEHCSCQCACDCICICDCYRVGSTADLYALEKPYDN